MHPTRSVSPQPDSTGFTLTELIIVVVLIGILASLAAPAMRRQIDRMRSHTTLDRLAGNLYYARMVAVRSGRGVQVRFAWDGDGSCIESYQIVELGPPERAVKTVLVSEDLRGLCLKMNINTPVSINSRGLAPSAMRSWWIVRGAVADSLKLSQAGRTLRTY